METRAPMQNILMALSRVMYDREDGGNGQF